MIVDYIISIFLWHIRLPLFQLHANNFLIDMFTEGFMITTQKVLFYNLKLTVLNTFE